MAWAQEMKNLAAEIKTGHIDRATKIKEIKGETRNILAEADAFMKKTAVELKDMAKDLKDFLAKSEDTRKKDFDAMIKVIRARVKDIKGDTADLLVQFDKEMKELAADLKDFLQKNEANRIADFKGMMKDINADIDAIRKAVGTILADYKAERKEAAGYWGRLKGKEAVSAEKAAAKKQKKHQNEKEE